MISSFADLFDLIIDAWVTLIYPCIIIYYLQKIYLILIFKQVVDQTGSIVKKTDDLKKSIEKLKQMKKEIDNESK